MPNPSNPSTPSPRPVPQSQPTHACCADGCREQVSKHLVFCARHWWMVSRLTQNAVYAARRAMDRPSWEQAVREAQEEIRQAEAAAAVPLVAIYGYAMPYREELVRLGGRYDPARRAWLVPAEHGRYVMTMIPGCRVQTLPGGQR